MDGEELRQILEVKGISQANFEHLVRINGSLEKMDRRIEKLEFAAVKEQGAREEREKWEEREAKRIEHRFTAQTRLIMAGIAAAGVLSGIVFSVLDKVGI